MHKTPSHHRSTREDDTSDLLELERETRLGSDLREAKLLPLLDSIGVGFGDLEPELGAGVLGHPDLEQKASAAPALIVRTDVHALETRSPRVDAYPGDQRTVCARSRARLSAVDDEAAIGEVPLLRGRVGGGDGRRVVVLDSGEPAAWLASRATALKCVCEPAACFIG